MNNATRDIELSQVQKLIDKDAIRQCLFRYARAIDRVDKDLLRQVYWPEAVDNHGTYNGPVGGFIEHVIPALLEMDQTIHFFGNILIELHGDRAASEAYFFACHRYGMKRGQPKEFTLGGRYLDRFEKRAGEWRILRRDLAYDWVTENNSPADWMNNPLGIPITSHRLPDDTSKLLFAKEPADFIQA